MALDRRRWLVPLLAALPGFAVITASLAGRVPSLRDLATYFLPLRASAAEVLLARRSPFWSSEIGAGEPWFANPQTGVLYPPAWLAVWFEAIAQAGFFSGSRLRIPDGRCASMDASCRDSTRLGSFRPIRSGQGDTR